MKNKISVLRQYTITPKQIDDLLPFTGKTVFFRGIERYKYNAHLWELELDIKIDGVDIILHYMPPSTIIETWYTGNMDLNHTTINKAIALTLSANVKELEKFNDK